MAASELQKCGNRNGEAVALLVLNCYLKKDLNLNDRQELHYAVSACHSCYLSEIRKPDGQKDVYRAFVFGLLSVGKLERGTSVSFSIPEFTIEDFLWTELWFIQSSRLLGLTMKTPLAIAHTLHQIDEDDDNDNQPRPITGYYRFLDIFIRSY
jgi:hypothetical protein